MVELTSLTDPSLAVVILAGGEGRRMGGVDKGLVEWQSRPLITHVLSAAFCMLSASNVSPRVWISANRNQSTYQSFPSVSGVVSDDSADFKGPLAGIASMLAIADWKWLLILPCDMPLLPAETLTRLWSARVEGGVAVACTGAAENPKWFPVVSLAHRDAVLRIAERLANQKRSVMGWIEGGDYRLVRFEDSRDFANCNDLLTLGSLAS